MGMAPGPLEGVGGVEEESELPPTASPHMAPGDRTRGGCQPPGVPVTRQGSSDVLLTRAGEGPLRDPLSPFPTHPPGGARRTLCPS